MISSFYKNNQDKIEIGLIILAMLSVIAYLTDLLGVFQKFEILHIYQSISLIVDCVFVGDFLIKIYIFRLSYFKGPWWLVDFIAALPIIASLGFFTGIWDSVRITRTVRFFLILRVLRILRLTRVYKLMQFDSKDVNESESKKFKYTIWASTLFLTFFLITCMYYIHNHYSEEIANIIEFNLVLGLVVATLLSLFIVRVQVPDVTRSQIAKLLNIALPKQVADSFLKDPSLMNKAIEMPATIIFTDLIGFTSIVEDLNGDHKKLRSYLQKSLGIICDEHIKNNLIIDKFMGDCVMSFKGGNLVNGSPEEHAFSVVKASLNSKLVLRNSNLKYFNNARIGGASTDSALIGSFGTEKRLTYTVLGDAVNLASRLESASKHLGVENLFCEKTMKLTNNNCEFIWREVGDLIVEGKRNSIKGFEAILNNEDNRKWIDIFHKGLKYYTSKEFIDAKAEFSKVIELKFNGDNLSKYYINNCDNIINSNLPKNWQPIIETRK